MNEEPFEFRGRDGAVRRGILTPAEPGRSNGTGIVLLPAGLKYRIGPHRLNVTLARRLAPVGYTVLRFDPCGVGESDGALPAGPLRELWRTVEQGRFVDDTLHAARDLRERCGLQRLVLGGLCGGAVTALLAAALAPELIDGVLSINTAVTFSTDTKPARRPMGRIQARHNFKGYLRKLLAPAAWARIVRGDSDYSEITRTVVATVRSCLGARRRPEHLSHENARFMESFESLERRSVPHLLIFSGNDNRWLEFQEVVLQRRLGGRLAGSAYEIEVIPNANHELHFADWQRELEERFADWLNRRFRDSGRPVRAMSA
ncbi:hydrolase [Sulfurifustis variabilis]|uniref:Hydrolase n=1 Tax=Sulfurifustis variabilis TaxID=1675686 RepID=A0A1B4V2Z5_9GAMM|nr:alpha/beta hydrolase [Sulfurifustis variabilis]BAU47908.1 hydrolase [Sulfurifustis variabilis]